MLQQQADGRQRYEREAIARKFAHPRRLDIFFHAFKTLKLIKALVLDRRIAVYRKLLFFGTVGGLVVILLFPDLLSEAVLSTILPLLGTVAGVPIDAGFDWMAFALVAVNMLRYFPADIVAEHYTDIFKR
jgi:hypothetical protein